MPDDIFVEPRLAGLYDALNPPDASLAFYLELAGTSPKYVLDMGCGTGLLAVELARRGHIVHGADPAAAMLRIARKREGGDRVTWIDSDTARLDLESRFDLIVMTGHVFQVFLTDAEIRSGLANLRRHLAPGGRIAFETRNPAVEEWRYWTEALSAERVETADAGPVDVHWDVTSVEAPYVTFETRFRFADGTRATAPSTLRFMDRDELAAHLGGAGLTPLEWFGDWDGSPCGPTSPEIIVVAG